MENHNATIIRLRSSHFSSRQISYSNSSCGIRNNSSMFTSHNMEELWNSKHGGFLFCLTAKCRLYTQEFQNTKPLIKTLYSCIARTLNRNAETYPRGGLLSACRLKTGLPTFKMTVYCIRTRMNPCGTHTGENEFHPYAHALYFHFRRYETNATSN